MAEALIGIGDHVAFERRLVETTAWCSVRVKRIEPAGRFEPSPTLRSDDLRPADGAGRDLSPTSRTVRAVVFRRAEKLAASTNFDVNAGVRSGRLLACFPDHSLSCGAATVASSGFFDIANIPPWDTWIAMFRTGDRSMGPEYLVSWVPDSLLQDAAAGIDVNPEGCIIWLSETSTEVAARLRASGLLT